MAPRQRGTKEGPPPRGLARLMHELFRGLLADVGVCTSSLKRIRRARSRDRETFIKDLPLTRYRSALGFEESDQRGGSVSQPDGNCFLASGQRSANHWFQP